MRVDGWMGSDGAGDACAGLGSIRSSAVRADDRDEANASAQGGGGAAMDKGAGLRDRRDLVAHPIRLPRRQSLHHLPALPGPGRWLSEANENT